MTSTREMTDVFSPQEQVVFTLRRLYESFGYSRFPMRRFEEYSLYLENKSFLKGEGVLAFTNANGQLMALKPDVTLSIVKHARVDRQGVEKLYYNESVYRVAETDHEFAEIGQMGVEYLGDVDVYGACEVIRLALESLRTVAADHVLEVSHMGFAGGLMAQAGVTDEQKELLFSFIRQKNGHELRAALSQMRLDADLAERIAQLPSLSGSFEPTLERAAELAIGEDMRLAIRELRELHSALMPLGLCGALQLDFAILNDLDYYNGIVFQGYVNGVPRAVLSGGRYDHLMRKFCKNGGGIGFALYLDELTRLHKSAAPTVDVLVLYRCSDNAGAVLAAVDSLRKQGLRVLAAGKAPEGLTALKTMRLENGSLREVE